MSIFKKKKNKDDKGASRKAGFDNPLTNPEEDKLDRKRFIKQIYPYLTNLEPEWSVRVGLNAPWGEGKTTVCSWIAHQAEKDGHIPVWFSPWSARTDAQLWVGFYTALTKALKEYDDTYKTSIFSANTLKHMVSSLTNRGWSEDISRLHQIGESGMRVVQSLTKMKPQDAKRLRAHMKGKRFIVILDDLDRVDPALIPRLLMTLRDVLDLEGFSFLLPFDEKIVSNALKEYNPAPGFGENFLEKILDFRVHLEKPTKNEVDNFFKHEMQIHCPFITKTALNGLENFLPTNPRKLKALVRGMRIFESEAVRHQENEIDWKALVFAQMIRLESEAFFNVYATETFGDNTDDNSGFDPWITAAIEDDKDKAREDEINRIKTLLKKVDVTFDEKCDRLIEICEGWRDSHGVMGQHKIKYALRLLSQPETLTWAEFFAFWQLWSENNNFSALSPWFKKHSKKTQKPIDEVIREVLITLTQHYDVHLEKAGSVALRSEQASCVEKAKEILVLFEQFLDNDVNNAPHDQILTIEVFKRLLDVIAKWFHFRGNASDRQLRGEEEDLLKKWVRKIHELRLDYDYLSLLTKLENDRFGDEKDIARLYRELIEIVGVGMEQAALDALSTEEGINKIYSDGAGEAVKKVLLTPSSSIWLPEGSSSVEQILETASTNSAVQINARNFLDLLRKASNQGTWELRAEEVNEFFNHPSKIVTIWNAAIATELQFRRLKETRQIRDFLIAKGIQDEQLATPDWLMNGSEPVQNQELQEEAAE